ncbi:MAG: hypothetical protein JRI56_09375 [Deltaproteobacteria bacterium]|nr:hypothetical protein [Deltaproteobacteria bacterium]
MDFFWPAHACRKDTAISKARQWTKELMKSYHYPGALKNHFAKALEELMDLSLEQRKEIWEFIDQFLNLKTKAESVTQIS